MLTNIYECLAITLRSWRSLCDHCELMANGIRKPIRHTFATGETSITFETPQKRPRMLTNSYECMAIICDHYEFMANCIRKPIRHIFATVWEQHQILTSVKYLSFNLNGLESHLIPLCMGYQGLQNLFSKIGVAIRTSESKMAAKMAANFVLTFILYGLQNHLIPLCMGYQRLQNLSWRWRCNPATIIQDGRQNGR